MNLLVGFYADAAPGRTEEFVECLRRNTDNPLINTIRVFLEDPLPPAEAKARFPGLAHPKVHLVAHGRRLTFKRLFDYANLHLARAGAIIANADIYFDDTLALIEGDTIAGRMLCLSRWDEVQEGVLRHLDRPDSQDAWIFEPPLPGFNCDFCLGKPGCDGRLAYEAERAGLTVSNPSRSLRARHLHRSSVRRYSSRERLHGPLRFVPPSFLDDPLEGLKPGDPPLAEFPSHRVFRKECVVHKRYQEIQAALAPHFGGKVPRGVGREVLRALRSRIDEPQRPLDEPLASVAFRETMGYTLARLECGVSTHNDDPRPLVSVPAELAGAQFTQVVSCRSTPVEIEFRSRGRLFVLAAPGWEGYAAAATFLDGAGWREPFEPLRTGTGTIFEAWSLVADPGERLVIPTQVMLAAAELIPLG